MKPFIHPYSLAFHYKNVCSGNRYLYVTFLHRFADTPVLEGLSVHETRQYVYILLATVSSVHRIRLPHPNSTQASFDLFWLYCSYSCCLINVSLFIYWLCFLLFSLSQLLHSPSSFFRNRNMNL